MKALRLFLFLILGMAGVFAAVGSDSLSDEALQQLDFRQYPGRQLPLHLSFVDEEGRVVRLGDFFSDESGRVDPVAKRMPVILVPGYFRCRTLCSGITDGLLHALQGSRKSAGNEFRVLYVSIDPEEKISEARARKQTWMKRYGRLQIHPDACHFLSGTSDAIRELAEQIGFEYRYDPPSGEYAHLAGFLVVQPNGAISRYFFGVSFSSGELDGALDAAAKMKTGSVIKEFLLLCFHYNPIRSRYGYAIMWVVRGLALATIAGLIWLVVKYQPKAASNYKKTDPRKDSDTPLAP